MPRLHWTESNGHHHCPAMPEAQIEDRGAWFVLIDTETGAELARGGDLPRLKKHAEVVFGWVAA